MFNEYHITMDSFGSDCLEDCLENWEEIADYLNVIIDNLPDITDPDTGDLTPDGRKQIYTLWEQYCTGELPDAPAPIME